MSFDAGGLAQMACSNFSNGALGVPGAGFASRGKGDKLKRLSVPAPPKMSSTSPGSINVNPTPRTSRSHLLAGLRTAPKTPTTTASFNQQQCLPGIESSKFGQQSMKSHGFKSHVPASSVPSYLPMTGPSSYGIAAGDQMYSLQEQVLAPRSVQYNDHDGEQMDPNIMAQLMAAEMYLQQRQQQLQQQLITLQFQGLQLGSNNTQQSQYPCSQRGMARDFSKDNSMLQEVSGQPGVCIVYNPSTGQYNYSGNSSTLFSQFSSSSKSASSTNSVSSSNRQSSCYPERSLQADAGPDFYEIETSPSRKSGSPQEVNPLPPPSANAFRPSHKKVSSLALKNISGAGANDMPKSALMRSSGYPSSPITGTFGPGQGSVGEHPVRQPRGPPSLEELLKSPTTKHPGSKNFVTGQRWRAVDSLVRAGIERRGCTMTNGSSPVLDGLRT